MLYGMKLIIYTDYQNLIFNTSSLHIKCQQLLIVEFDYELKYVLQKENMIADTISCMHTLYNQKSLFSDDMFYVDVYTNFSSMDIFHNDITYLDNFFGESTSTFTFKLPIDYKIITEQQALDDKLQRNLHDNPAYTIGRVTQEQHKIIFYNDKIFVLPILIHSIMNWYHNNLIYPRMDQLLATISQHFFGLI